jgi:hypothetical protein
LPLKPEALRCSEVDQALLLWLNSNEPGSVPVGTGVYYSGEFHASPSIADMVEVNIVVPTY